MTAQWYPKDWRRSLRFLYHDWLISFPRSGFEFNTLDRAFRVKPNRLSGLFSCMEPHSVSTLGEILYHLKLWRRFLLSVAIHNNLKPSIVFWSWTARVQVLFEGYNLQMCMRWSCIIILPGATCHLVWRMKGTSSGGSNRPSRIDRWPSDQATEGNGVDLRSWSLRQMATQSSCTSWP